MPASTDRSFIQLLWELMNEKTGELGKVTFQPQKPDFDPVSAIEQPFPRSTPEEQGISSGLLTGLLQKLRNNDHVQMHQMMILCNDHVILECAFDPYQRGMWHTTFSACKSMTGMAIGLLVDDGRITVDDHVLNYFPEKALHVMTALRFGNLQIRDLLIMSGGATYNEVGAIAGDDWVKGYFEAGTKFMPGSKFDYNSMNSFILSAIVQKVTGMTMMEFLSQRIFEPMGIKKVFWEKSPKGITKGGWGMLLTPEDAAKLGTLYLKKGNWNGQQLISEKWVEESTSMQIETGNPASPGYGYQLWTGTRPGSFMYNGLMGQNVYVYPDVNMVIVTNAGNSDIFSDGGMTSMIRETFPESWSPSPEPLPENRSAYRELNETIALMEGRSMQPVIPMRGGWKRKSPLRDLSALSLNRLLASLDGKCYVMKQSGIGLFPLIMQVTLNNYTKGVKELTFRYDSSELFLDFLEGDVVKSIPVGFGKGKITSIDMNGESYIVGTTGRISYNEDHEPVLSLRICFLEHAAERTLKIVFRSMEHIVLFWSETPGNTMITNTLELVTTGSGNSSHFVTGLLGQVSPSLIEKTMNGTISPAADAYIKTELHKGEGDERAD